MSPAGRRCVTKHYMEKRSFFALVIIVLFAFIFIFYHITQSTQITHSKEYKELQELEKVSWNFNAYQEYFTNLAQEKGALYAFDVLRQASIPTGVDVHNLAHFIGYELYKERNVEGIAECTDEFSNACSHAIVIQTFVEQGEGALREISTICSHIPGSGNAYASCFHGLGHGILVYLNYELDGAISLCKEASQFAPELQRETALNECVGGTIMELTSGLHDVEVRDSVAPRYLPNDDLLAPCNSNLIPESTKPFCYIYLTGRFLEFSGAMRATPSPEAYPEAFSWCNRISEEEVKNRDACYGGFGKDFVYFAADGDVRKVASILDKKLLSIHEWCSFAGNESGERSCVLTAADTLRWLGTEESSEMFCMQSKDKNTEMLCLQRVRSVEGSR